MAEENQKPTTELEELAKDNKELKNNVTVGQKYLMWGMIAVSVIAIFVVIYIFCLRNPGIKKANEAIGAADTELMLGSDSVALAQYRKVADDFGSDAGNRAALMAATISFREGKYEEALADLKGFSPKESIVGAAGCSLEGDCYVNLQKYPEAVKAYDKAIAQSDNNALYTPLFMMKKATVLRAQGDYAAELKVLEKVKSDYPQYTQAYRLDIDKYIARAKQQAGK